MRSRLALLGPLLVVLLVAIHGAGCRQIVGIESSPQFHEAAPLGEVPTTCRAVPFASETCAECMGSACCAEVERCGSVTGCKSFTECFATCAGVATCASGCRDRFRDGYGAEAAMLHSCEATRCASVCGVTCGGYVYPSAKCGECGVARCCDVAAKCAGEVECSVLGACERACALTDSVCLQQCELAHPEGVTSERAFGACIASTCATSCVARQWACLEDLPGSPPPPTGRAISITYSFFDYQSLQAIPGVSLRACGKTDFDCATPIGTPVITEPNGQAVMRFPGNSFDGYVEVTGEGYGTVLIYVPPVTKDYIVGALPLVKRPTFIQLLNAIVPGGVDPSLGSVMVNVRNCSGVGGAGVSLAIEPSAGTTQAYLAGRIPSATATETDSDYAVGGFANVRPGTALTIRATVVENGLPYKPAIVFARQGNGTTTVVVMPASPP